MSEHTRCERAALRRLRAALRRLNASRRKRDLPESRLVDEVTRAVSQRAAYVDRVLGVEKGTLCPPDPEPDLPEVNRD